MGSAAGGKGRTKGAGLAGLVLTAAGSREHGLCGGVWIGGGARAQKS
jgi:hypothetical protein